MAEVRVEGDDVVVALSRWERLGALRGDVRVPLDAVRSLRRVDEARRALRGVRAPGTGWPGRIALGTWRRRGSKDFVAVYRREPGFVLELDGHEFGRIIVTGELPAELAGLAAPE